MGANAQTTVQKFLSGAVLTAEQQNFSAATGVPVFATTVTRDAAFGGANKVLAEGQTCYLESTNVVQFYDGAAWATVGPAAAGALVRVGGGALGSSSTTFTGVFSATYNDYLITIDNVTTSSGSGGLRLRLGSATANYGWSFNRVTFAGTGAVDSSGGVNAANFMIIDGNSTNPSAAQIFVHGPFLTIHTSITFQGTNNTGTPFMANGGGIHLAATSFTDFTLTLAATMAGNVNVYGLALS